MGNNNNEMNRLRAVRIGRNLSQSMLAAETDISVSTIKRAERGKSIGPSARKLLTEYFGKSSEELGLTNVLEHEEREPVYQENISVIPSTGEDVQRRQFLKGFGIAGAAIFTGNTQLLGQNPWEKISQIVNRSTYIDPRTIQQLDMLTKNYWLLRSSMPVNQVIPQTVQHLDYVLRLLDTSLLPETRKQLCTVIGKISMILGEMSFEAHDLVAAEGYFNAAIDAGNESEDFSLTAVTLGRLGHFFALNNHLSDGLAALQAIRRIPLERIHPSVRVWVAVAEAETHALMHDSGNCQRTIDIAKSVGNGDYEQEDPYLLDVAKSTIPAFEGACYLHLRQPDLALPALQQSLIDTDMALLPRRAHILADIATGYAQTGKLQESCGYVQQALIITRQIDSGIATERIRHARTLLESWKNTPEVRMLDEQMIPSWR